MISIEFNDGQVQSGLDALGQLLDDMTPVFAEIGEQFVRSHKLRFAAGEALARARVGAGGAV